ncbi:NnrS family protein [Ostreiculturibacter nitratireducens]|uniref:NnrS family protein n=1 Tax=Ostreiculturibacter nitratireducens TaxID=3075226 RepID=UPI0031B61C05
MKGTAERMRAWRGPALFSYGFRPFFLGAGIWASLAMALWVAALTGRLSLPTHFDPVSWHAHEFLFGYLGAVVAGFLLTAVPNWTGRLPIIGAPLAVLATFWVLGRVAVAVSAHLPPLAVAIADLSMPVLLALAIAREIVRGRNWRNLIVLALLAIMILGNGLFHWAVSQGQYAVDGAGFRLGLSGGVMMIAVIGGRIVPSFTRNWLVKRGEARLPAPSGRFDRVALLVLPAALAAWVAAPASAAAGTALLLAGVIHVARLARWRPVLTGGEPLVWVLHLGYAFLPAGALALGAAILWPALLPVSAALHLWLAGAIGMMTLAVMTRATLGHTGQALTAGHGTAALYLLLLVAVVARVCAGLYADWARGLYYLAGLAWIGAFGGFAFIYGPLLLRRRSEGRTANPGRRAQARSHPAKTT